MKIASLFQFTIFVAMLAHALGFNACMYSSTITLPTCMRVFYLKENACHQSALVNACHQLTNNFAQ